MRIPILSFMDNRRSGLLSFLVVMLLAALPRMTSATEIKGQIDIGVAAVNLDHPHATAYGEYNGLDDDQSWLIADADLRYSPAQNYFSLQTHDLGLDSRELQLGWGSFGVYGMTFEYSEFPHLLSNNAMTPFSGVGSDDLNLPAGFIRGGTTADMSNLIDHLQDVELRLDRTSDHLQFFLTPDEHWRFDLSVKREDIDGITSQGGAINTAYWANPGTILPMPVDQQLDTVDIAVGYAVDKAQWKLTYRLSEFDNNLAALSWDNPFSTPAPWSMFLPPIAGYPTEAQNSLPPDNNQQSLILAGAVNLPGSNRLTMSVEKSRLEQDTDLLPYTSNSSLTVSEPLPRTSAEARIDITHLNIGLHSKPTDNLSLNTRYRHHDSDNKTPRTLFLRVINDTIDQAAENSSTARYSVPYSTTEDQLSLDGTYNLGNGTTLKLAYQHEIIDRTYRAVDKTKENTLKAGINKRSKAASAQLAFTRGWRRADSPYDELQVYEQLHSQSYVATVTANERFNNNPLLQQYDIADRDQSGIVLAINLYSFKDLILGTQLRDNRDEFPESTLGLKNNELQSLTFDFDYQPEYGMPWFGYYTKDYMSYELAGREFNPTGAGKYLNANNANNDWTINNNDDIDTVGIGTSLWTLDDLILLKLKYDYSHSENDITVIAASNLGSRTRLPVDKFTHHRIELNGEYELNPRMLFNLGIIYERFRSDNWHTDGIAAGSDSVDEILILMGPEPDYSAYTIYTTVRYSW